jgi:hypothetical protein
LRVGWLIGFMGELVVRVSFDGLDYFVVDRHCMPRYDRT